MVTMAVSITQVLNLIQKRGKKNSKEVSSDAQGNLLSVFHWNNPIHRIEAELLKKKKKVQLERTWLKVEQAPHLQTAQIINLNNFYCTLLG